MLRTLLLLSVVFLNLNCGFKPLYSKKEGIRNYNIEIIVKSDQYIKYSARDKQTLRTFLSEKINDKSKKKSSLKVIIALNRSSYGLGLSKDLSTTKYGVSYDANYVFYDKKGIISRGTAQRSSSFDFGSSPYANLIAEETTNKNILKSLSNQLAYLTLTLPSGRKIFP